jgi:hypothetical protein
VYPPRKVAGASSKHELTAKCKTIMTQLASNEVMIGRSAASVCTSTTGAARETAAKAAMMNMSLKGLSIIELKDDNQESCDWESRSFPSDLEVLTFSYLTLA